MDEVGVVARRRGTEERRLRREPHIARDLSLGISKNQSRCFVGDKGRE